MTRGKEKRTIVYFDELNDEFSDAKIEAKKIDSKWDYLRENPFKRVLHVIIYRLIADPLARIYLKCKFRHKIVNKELIHSCKSGFFAYGNHTQIMADPLIPHMMTLPKRAYIIVHPNNVSMKGIGWALPYCGALPLPDDIGANKNFLKAIEKIVHKKKRGVFIYPEAHIWPYYTKIRPFVDTSFYYPIKEGVPSFCFTNVYKKRKNPNKCQIITYVDGPFYPNEELPLKERRKDLRDRIYETMKERSLLSDYEGIIYINGNEVKKDD